MADVVSAVVRCGDVEIDAQQEYVRRAGVEQRLRQKSFQVLLYLIANRHRVVPKTELFEAIWNGIAVTEDTLVQSVVEIRKALGDDPRSPQFIRTVPKSGYRFVAMPDDDEPRSGPSIEYESVQHVEVEIAEESDVRGVSVPVSRVAIAAAVVAIAVAVGALVHVRTTKSSEMTPHRTTVAVMFFEKQNGGANIDWLREGLSDMLITQLSRSDSLSVVGREQLAALVKRSDVAGARSLSVSQQLDVARQAQATRLITGTFAQLGGEIRVDAQLRDVASGKVLAGESVVAQPDQLLARIDGFSAALASRLAASDGHPMRLADAKTDNLEAYKLYSLGVERLQGMHSEEAISLFEQAVAIDPDFAMAHARIGYAYGVVWQFPDRARPYLDRALQLPNRLSQKDRMYVEAWHAIVDRNYPAAIELFQTLIARYPTEVEAYYRAAMLLRGEERRSEAVEVIERGLLVDPSSPILYNALGGIYVHLNRMHDAIEAHRKYVALSPREPNAHDSLGVTLQATGAYENAINEYQTALAIDPLFEIARLHLANTYFQTGRYREAMRELDRYVAQAPSDVERSRGYDGEAWVYRSRGDLARAEELAKKAARLNDLGTATLLVVLSDRHDWSALRKVRESLAADNPSSRGTRPGLRWTYFDHGYEALKSGNASAAVNLFQRSLQYEAPYHAIDAHDDSLADAYLSLGRYDDALREYRKVLAINPNHALAHFHMAAAFDHLGRHDDAKHEYERFLTVWSAADADVPEVIEARKRLHAS